MLQVKWITFHSGYDFGYLLKVLTCQPLPPTEEEFFELLKVSWRAACLTHLRAAGMLLACCISFFLGMWAFMCCGPACLGMSWLNAKLCCSLPLQIYFPTVYDIKYLMKFCDNLHGGLNKLAEVLEVARIGPQHQAGSDSLLTSAAFTKLAHDHFKGFEALAVHQGVLFGLGADGLENADNLNC